jgi:hypothetical protein
LSSRNQYKQNIFKTNKTDEALDIPENLTGSTHEFKRMETLSSLQHSRSKSKDALDFSERRAGRDFEKSTEYSIKRR